jgi:hypothetical protein
MTRVGKERKKTTTLQAAFMARGEMDLFQYGD